MAVIRIDTGKLAANVAALKRLADGCGVEIAAVTKAFCGDPVVARIFVDNGVTMLADSRLSNLRRMAEVPGQRMLLRAPTFDEAAEAVKLCDMTLISHVETARALSASAVAQGRPHAVLLMLDTGDLREGVCDADEAVEIATAVADLPGIELRGLGVNYACMCALLPTPCNLAPLAAVSERITSSSGIGLPVLSGGNSSALSLMMRGKLPAFVNHLRIGESFFRGCETAYGEAIADTHRDCVELRAEIIELREKPSAPGGETGANGFGERRRFENRGRRMRAICSVGRRDVSATDLTPLDPRIEVIGASSDHLVLDMEACRNEYAFGDQVAFSLNYAGVLSAMASPDVERRFV